MNVPKLRFKEFTDEWKKVELDKLYEFKNGLNGDRSLYGKGVELINVSDILNNTYITSKVINGKININENTLRKNSVEYGDILFQRSSETFLEIGTSNVYLDNKLVTFSGFVIRGKRKKDNINNPLFINYVLKSPTLRKKIIICGSGAQHYNIGQEDLKRITIFLPSIKEQKKIADMLELLDKKIELQTKKIEALKLFKKGLFDIQLKINGKESIMFDDFLDEVTEKSSIQNQYPVLSSTSKGLFLQSDYFNKQASSENNVGYKILKRNQLVLSPQNLWMGNININNIFDIGIVSPSYRIYNIDIKKMDLNYFNYWIKTPKALYSYLISSEQGASIVRRNLNIEMFNQISLKVPKLEKQHIIGNKIYQFNLKINFEEEKLKQLHKLKKALLQNMFV